MGLPASLSLSVPLLGRQFSITIIRYHRLLAPYGCHHAWTRGKKIQNHFVILVLATKKKTKKGVKTFRQRKVCAREQSETKIKDIVKLAKSTRKKPATHRERERGMEKFP